MAVTITLKLSAIPTRSMNNRLQVFLTVFMTAAIAGFILAEGYQLNPYEGLSEVDNVSARENTITVSTKCFKLDMTVPEHKASLIQTELYEGGAERVTAQQIIGEISKDKIRRVEITGLKKEAYQAQLIVGKGINQREIDLRPSDGILVAVDQDIPLMIDTELIRSQGINNCLQGTMEI